MKSNKLEQNAVAQSVWGPAGVRSLHQTLKQTTFHYTQATGCRTAHVPQVSSYNIASPSFRMILLRGWIASGLQNDRETDTAEGRKAETGPTAHSYSDDFINVGLLPLTFPHLSLQPYRRGIVPGGLWTGHRVARVNHIMPTAPFICRPDIARIARVSRQHRRICCILCLRMFRLV